MERREKPILMITHCARCGFGPLRTAPGNPGARPIRRRMRPGYCATCAMTAFLKDPEFPMAGILAERGPGILLAPHVREQMARLMEVGQSEAAPSEIDWERLVANWELPL